MDDGQVQNIIIINNTTLSYDEVVDTYQLTTDYGSKFSPRIQKPPLCMNMFEKYGTAPENAWRNFLFVCGQMPWQSVVSTEDLKDKYHFTDKLLSLGTNYVYVDLVLITKKDICKLVYDKNPTSKEDIINLLKEEIAFRERCSKYVFDTIEDYPDMDHYDLDRYQEIVNTYNEIR